MWKRTVIEVARQAGHSPTMALATYGHVIEELEDTVREPAEDVIRKAGSGMFPQSSLEPLFDCCDDRRAPGSCCKSLKAL